MKRRTFLRGAAMGAAALAMPSLRLTDARAADPTFPKRLVVFFSPNGTIYDNWVPSGGETNFTLSPILSPLEPFRDKLIPDVFGEVVKPPVSDGSGRPTTPQLGNVGILLVRQSRRPGGELI